MIANRARRSMLTTLFASALIAIGSGCFSVEKDYPDRRDYLIEYRGEPAATANPNGPTLKVSRLRVSQAFEARELVYRKSETRFEADYYRTFFAPPATMLTDALRAALASQDLFARVVPTSSLIESPYVVEGLVNRLYGDYRDAANPTAVFQLQLFLVRDDGVETEVLLERSYRMTEPMEDASAEALVEAYDRAFTKAVDEYVGELRTVGWR